MAARRLVVVMLVLLAISTLAAALLPPAERDDAAAPDRPRSEQGREPPGQEPRTRETGLLLAARMRAGRPQPKTVRIERGDELQLEVAAPFGADVEIGGLGLTAVLTPFASARFDLLATDTGSFPVRVTPGGSPAEARLVGRLVVGGGGSGRCGVFRPGARRGRGSARSCSRRDRRGREGAG